MACFSMSTTGSRPLGLRVRTPWLKNCIPARLVRDLEDRLALCIAAEAEGG